MKLQNGIIKFMKELSVYDTMQLVLLQNKIHIELMKRKQKFKESKERKWNQIKDGKKNY